jgi:hypothetical protein
MIAEQRRMRVAAGVLFLGAFLGFGVQPMAGRALLAAFGGGAAVWTVCLTMFQLLLLGGYFYSHALLSGRGQARRRGVFHVCGVVLAAAWLGAVAAAWPALRGALGWSASPVLEVALTVLALVGPPYLLLCANSTVVQAWAREDAPGRGVYTLYGFSNLGSVCGLLAYPLLIEPFLPLTAQWWLFGGAVAVYAAALARVLPAASAAAPGEAEPTPAAEPAALAQRAFWFAMPFVSTFALNSVTTHLSTDVLAVPFLWVALLVSFLLSFIAGFTRYTERRLDGWCLAALSALIACACVWKMEGGGGFLPNLLSGGTFVFCAGTFLHGWLFRSRPDAARLSVFYLCVAAGGAAGGFCSGFLPPLVFTGVTEYPVALVLAASATLAFTAREGWREKRFGPAAAPLLLFAAFLGIVGYSAHERAAARWGKHIAAARNFYGCLTVYADTTETPLGTREPMHGLRHGQTLHGAQWWPHYLRQNPTSYYGASGGGYAVLNHPDYTAGRPLSVGVVGLGAGTMACWGRAGDDYTFFEINPQVIRIASDTNLFTYLADTPARVSIVQGDARRTLAGATNRFDVLVMDAYAGDAVPYHLATKEAFGLYLDRLADGGVLAVHISNWNIDLFPLCKAASETYQLNRQALVSQGNNRTSPAQWVLLSRSPIPEPGAADKVTHRISTVEWDKVRPFRLPTDERGSLLPLIAFDRFARRK